MQQAGPYKQEVGGSIPAPPIPLHKPGCRLIGAHLGGNDVPHQRNATASAANHDESSSKSRAD